MNTYCVQGRYATGGIFTYYVEAEDVITAIKKMEKVDPKATRIHEVMLQNPK